MNHVQDIEKLEATLWEAADNLHPEDLRANSHKSSSEYCMHVLSVIFLRHATNRLRRRLP
jgi:type I restriction enzyme M protein